jgi:NAD+ synthase (glutamine-hydrolysing)
MDRAFSFRGRGTHPPAAARPPARSPVARGSARAQNRRPMRVMRVGLCQINPTVGDLEGNHRRIAEGIHRARAIGVDLLAFPEMAVPGYPPEDLLLKPSFLRGVLEQTRALVPLTSGMTVIVGTIDHEGDLYNAAAVLHDGRWCGTYRKRMLPNYGVFDENRYFMPGRENPVFVRGGTVIGVNVCEDIWSPGGPVEEQVLMGGAEVVVNISASPYHAGKAQSRRRMLATRAADNLAAVCYVNMVGGQDEIVFDGGSLIMDEQGRVLAEGLLFEEDLVVADISLDGVFHARLHDPRLRKSRMLERGAAARIELPDRAVPAPDGGLAVAIETKPALEKRDAAPARERVAEIYDALVLGARDYVRKNGFRTTVIGLSGGIDSALTACIAVDALGGRHVVGVSMPSAFTSEASREDAAALADALGIELRTIPVSEVFERYLQALAPSFADRPADTTEENLQARIRGNYLMALSNKFGWLVLTTGNKSEASVGYSTLYGDTAGGFSVLKDVWKTTVYELAIHRNRISGRPPIPERTITRPPSAELRENQTDQDSLPPYDVLDPILRMYVEEDRAVQEIAGLGFEEELVRRVVRMVDQAEYKRRQSPPGVKISPRAFGKDRRLPITSRWRV